MLTLFAALLSVPVMNSRTQIASLQTLQTLLHETTFQRVSLFFLFKPTIMFLSGDYDFLGVTTVSE